MQSRFERFSYIISQVNKYLHRIEAEEMKKYGLRGSYAVYLITMRRCENGVTASQLGDMCGRDKADVSRAISAMIDKGLVLREEVNKNSYRARLNLTKEGARTAEVIEERASLAVEMASKNVSDENRNVFYETLDMIALNLQSISEEGIPNNE
ncbi:MAG: hypothetical protein MJ172_07845 [Clostridia bacterium]|nr:hypothetical protein [Clostridia bacterium]